MHSLTTTTRYAEKTAGLKKVQKSASEMQAEEKLQDSVL